MNKQIALGAGPGRPLHWSMALAPMDTDRAALEIMTRRTGA